MRAVSRFSETLRNDWPRLIIELLVVVAGISISFALDEWRRDREDRREEHRVWVAIQDNLVADSATLAARDVRLRAFVAAYDGLLAGGPADSLDSWMDQAISYAVFTPTQTAFHELEQMAGSRLIHNRALLAELTSLYNREYRRAVEWDEINKNFVLERMIPYLDATAPYIASTGGGETATGLAAVYRSVEKRDQFRNLIRTNRLFKSAQQTVALSALKRLIDVRAKVAKEVAATASAKR